MGNALIRSFFAGVTPEKLTPEVWAERVAEAIWLEERKIKMMSRLFGGKN